jgi:imidazolonepropionase-like amidohydrolase/ABC-type multidrug transport system permease subunit
VIHAYWSLIRIHLKLAFREKNVLFFTYVFPLIFFFGFGQFMGGGALTMRVVAMVLVIGILGNGLFGAGLRAVVERETNILRRYRVTPITASPLLFASMVTGWLLFLPSAVMVIVLSRVVYHMPWPQRPFSLFVLLTLGCLAFRAIGLIIAAIANSMAEANVLIQLLYMPMLFLSGATIPVSVMPLYAQIVAQFLPASYLHTGMQQVLLRSQGLSASPEAVAALLASMVLAFWISVKLFRWEKEEKIPTRSKAWVAAVFLPFLILGGYQAYSREHINESKLLDRELRRKFARLIRDARIFTGDGRVIERGAVLLKDGRIERIYEGSSPDPDSLDADAVEAIGKTVLPALIDAHVHLGGPGGTMKPEENANPQATLLRASAAYLYSGVGTVRSAGDFTSAILGARQSLVSGTRIGADISVCGPLFTAPGGHGTEYFKEAPAFLRKMSEEEFIRIPKSPDEARQQVRELKKQGVDCIKAVLESGAPGMLFQRLDLSILAAVADQARAERLPLIVHTGDSRDIAEAVAVRAWGIEHGSFRDQIPDDLLMKMKQAGVFYNPTLSVAEAFYDLGQSRFDLLDRTLVQQVAPAGMLAATRKTFTAAQTAAWRERITQYPMSLELGMENLVRAWKAGVPVVTGTDSGNPLLIHGPAIHRELQLWVKAGIPELEALRAATHSAARSIRAEGRIGKIAQGHEATVLLVDGNPLQDISATERISSVFFKGERVDRQGLFDQK